MSPTGESLDCGDVLGEIHVATSPEPWSRPDWVAHAGLLLDSFSQRLGRELVAREGSAVAQAERLYRAPFVVVSHGTDDDPLLSYGNAAALALWEMDADLLTRTPSRLTAEPMHRGERARLLERTRSDGFVDDYTGVRISRTGRRFRIERAVVWNLTDAREIHRGQAATFDKWTPLG
ncbi:MAG: MEKHLA domain-containing protein [Planctomycetia bacterium]|nr:MEKHLA domain-containing protein [Planctomycetia bacterium]